MVVLLLAKQTARVRIPLFAPIEIFKEEKTMTNELRKLSLENRIQLLSERGNDNGKIVKKLERQLRTLKAKEDKE